MTFLRIVIPLQLIVGAWSFPKTGSHFSGSCSSRFPEHAGHAGRAATPMLFSPIAGQERVRDDVGNAKPSGSVLRRFWATVQDAALPAGGAASLASRAAM